MTWSGTWPRPPAENHVRTDAKLAEPGSCLENRASFAISLARCEAETAAMPSPWASSRRSSPPSALPRPSHGVCLRRHHPRSSDVGATTSDDVGRAWHVALVVPAPWGQRRRATRWQGLATATRWQSLETRASRQVGLWFLWCQLRGGSLDERLIGKFWRHRLAGRAWRYRQVRSTARR